jgi:hypothetical protein
MNVTRKAALALVLFALPIVVGLLIARGPQASLAGYPGRMLAFYDAYMTWVDLPISAALPAGMPPWRLGGIADAARCVKR